MQTVVAKVEHKHLRSPILYAFGNYKYEYHGGWAGSIPQGVIGKVELPQFPTVYDLGIMGPLITEIMDDDVSRSDAAHIAGVLWTFLVADEQRRRQR